MNHSRLKIALGFLSFLNPFFKGFSRKKAVVYCSRRQGPTALWEKLPKLHYCLFNRGKEHLLKTDVELQAGKINSSRKAWVLITDDARATVAGRSLGELIEELKSEFNVAVVYLHENPRNIRLWKDVVTIGPLELGDLGAVVAEEIKCLQSMSGVEGVLAISLECGEVLPNIRELEIPILHYIPEFLPTPRQIERLKKSRRDSTMQLFPSESWMKRAAEGMGVSADDRMGILDGVPSSALATRIREFEQAARNLLKEEEQQVGVILDSGFFLKEYAVPGISNARTVGSAYLAVWRSGWRPRKPCPGFHPGVYRDHHPELTLDPTIDFIRQGKPAGAWLTEVMREEELKVKSRKVEKKNSEIRAALHLHLHYTEGVGELLQKINASASRPDLFISTTSEEKRVELKVKLDKYGLQAKEIAVFPNRGRDIGPFLTGFGPKLFSDYEIVGHIHSKQSPHAHDDYLQNWVEFLEQGLVGNNGEMMDAILMKMDSDPSIGIVYPDDPGCFGWEGNYTYGEDLLKRMGFQSPDKDASMNFPVGTMFWARSEALKPLLDLNLKWEDYPEEPIPIDGSMLHAMERIFGILPGLCGFRTVVTAVEGVAR